MGICVAGHGLETVSYAWLGFISTLHFFNLSGDVKYKLLTEEAEKIMWITLYNDIIQGEQDQLSQLQHKVS